jgi:hypothetical protein
MVLFRRAAVFVFIEVVGEKIMQQTFNNKYRIASSRLPGLVFRNGLKMGYTIGKFELSGTIFTDVLLRRYWNHNNYLGSIEPYPRAAMGGSMGLGYKINLKK